MSDDVRMHRQKMAHLVATGQMPQAQPVQAPQEDSFASWARHAMDSSDPMTQAYAQDRGFHDVAGAGYGLASAANLGAAIVDPEPFSKVGFGAVSAGTGALALDHAHRADRAARGERMWSNTGLPGRPKPYGDLE